MMNDQRDKAPSAEEIERRFHSPVVVFGRPALWGAMSLLKAARRFQWSAEFDVDLEQVEGPLVFAANHRSHADTGAILGTLPRAIRDRTAVAAALDVFGRDSSRGLRKKVQKDCLQLLVAAGFHAFAFDRQGPPLRSVRTSVQLIRNGWNLLLYPEGGRTQGSELRPFKAGVGVLARFTDRPVIPIHVDGGHAVLPYGEFLPRRGTIVVRYGAPMWLGQDESPNDFAARVQEQVAQLGRRTVAAKRARRRALVISSRRWAARPRLFKLLQPFRVTR